MINFTNSYIFSLLFYYSILSIINIASSSNHLQCRDDHGRPVDWYFIYKLPRIQGETDGTEYLYLTPETVEKGWLISEKRITSDNSMPGHTLAPLYLNNSDSLWILYNDQPPDTDNYSKGGHTKGVVAANYQGGFWLVQSVPHFPSSPESGKYIYPHTGHRYGQSFLCITLPKDQIDNVGLQLQYNEIEIFWKSHPSQFTEQYPYLSAAAKGQRVHHGPWNKFSSLKTAGGNEFQSFAKSAKYHKDIYEDFVAPGLKANLLVESWLNGPRPLPSSCLHPFKVYNIEDIKVCEIESCTHFSSRNDHSKWAISTRRENPWICVGDINRAETQERRGGGTVCWNNENVWKAYHQSVKSVVPCQKGFESFNIESFIHSV